MANEFANSIVRNTKNEIPFWLDKIEYPFTHRFLNTKEGKIHYVDEGEGEVILFVHGTPTWSFLYRNYIKELSKRFRCIALDHIGFGLSEKKLKGGGNTEYHSQNLELFIQNLRLEDITLIVHDFGGPIGLSNAIQNPHLFKRIVLFNTWMWETKTHKDAKKIDRLFHSRIGNWLYLNTNFSPKYLFKSVFYNKRNLTKNIHKHYYKPFSKKEDRFGLLNIGKSLIGSSDWYNNLWKQRHKISHLPALILWGKRDKFIDMDSFEKWQNCFSSSESSVFEAGHFVQEEFPEESLNKLSEWLIH